MSLYGGKDVLRADLIITIELDIAGSASRLILARIMLEARSPLNNVQPALFLRNEFEPMFDDLRVL